MPSDELMEMTRAMSYTLDVYEAHCRSNAHSLGCDIAIAWMKKTLGKPLSDQETLDLERHLPPEFHLGRLKSTRDEAAIDEKIRIAACACSQYMSEAIQQASQLNAGACIVGNWNGIELFESRIK